MWFHKAIQQILMCIQSWTRPSTITALCIPQDSVWQVNIFNSCQNLDRRLHGLSTTLNATGFSYHIKSPICSALERLSPLRSKLTALEYFCCYEHLECFSNSLWAAKRISASCVKQATDDLQQSTLTTQWFPQDHAQAWSAYWPDLRQEPLGEFRSLESCSEMQQKESKSWCLTLHTGFERVSYFSKKKMGNLIAWRSCNFSSECTCCVNRKWHVLKFEWAHGPWALRRKIHPFPSAASSPKDNR